MSILITGMEMPKSCEDCPMAFSVNFGILCTPTHNIVGDGEISKKQCFCPLVHVPPHGKLIDADALLNDKSVGTQIAGWGKMFHETAIEYAPTIIPAEPKEGK